jgi:hypothetical protein
MNEEINQEKEEILYLNRELNRKNILIKQLQERIGNLIDEKKYLINEINILKNENYIIMIKSEKNFYDNKIIYDKKEKEFLYAINNLKNIFDEREKNQKKLDEHLRKKLSKAFEEINNLKAMNNNRDNILLLINNFFNNIKNNLNLNYELHLDFIPYIFDKTSFVINLKLLENEILNKIKISKNKVKNKQKDIFMNRLNRKEKKKINIKPKKENNYFRTPGKNLIDKINRTYIDYDNNSSNYLLDINNSRLNNTII